jgi:hypothetical protein
MSWAIVLCSIATQYHHIVDRSIASREIHETTKLRVPRGCEQTNVVKCHVGETPRNGNGYVAVASLCPSLYHGVDAPFYQLDVVVHGKQFFDTLEGVVLDFGLGPALRWCGEIKRLDRFFPDDIVEHIEQIIRRRRRTLAGDCRGWER